MRSLRAYLDRRSRACRLLLLVTVVILGYLTTLAMPSFWTNAVRVDGRDFVIGRRLLEETSNETQKDPLFPKDLFTMEERRSGAVVFHIFGMIYMFVALAIVCDEYFIPALDVIIEKLEIQDDVAGATFMAAGGSAPELFTSVIGVFVSFNNVGIGTIVGSAVFNILFVIGMCALFSHSVLNLTWWPLFRDVTFYSVSLLSLIGFFLNNRIDWWESAAQLSIYFAYVYFMCWNETLEKWVKRHVTKNKVARVSSADQLVTSNGAPLGVAKQMQPGPVTLSVPAEAAISLAHRRASTPIIHSGSKFRHGLLQLMIHSIDPMNEDQQAKIDEKSTQIHAIASLKVLLDATRTNANASTPTGTATTTVGDIESESPDYLSHGDHPSQVRQRPVVTMDGGQCSQVRDSVVSIKGDKGMVTTESANQLNHVVNHVTTSDEDDVDEVVDIPENKEPVDLSWPDTNRKRITYVLLIPIMLPLWLTLADTRRLEKKKWFVCTFVGSILWIAGFSYLMVWWATVAGETMSIPSEVMGLTFLAAGTSIPDLITSVIVARKGLGDMAVSSSIGSNIFDVTVGLPLPWLLYGIIHSGDPVPVSSRGMACSIILLFLMLIFVIMTIACCRWRMNKSLGITMFVLYFAFLTISLLFEYGQWTCPV